MAGIPENPVPDSSRGEGRLSPDRHMVSVDVSVNTLVTLETILWGMTMARTIVMRSLEPTDNDSDVHSTSVRLIERIHRSVDSVESVLSPVALSLNGEEIDLLNSRLQLLGGKESASDGAKESVETAFREINEGFIQAGQPPRPAYADFLHGGNRN